MAHICQEVTFGLIRLICYFRRIAKLLGPFFYRALKAFPVLGQGKILLLHFSHQLVPVFAFDDRTNFLQILFMLWQDTGKLKTEHRFRISGIVCQRKNVG